MTEDEQPWIFKLKLFAESQESMQAENPVFKDTLRRELYHSLSFAGLCRWKERSEEPGLDDSVHHHPANDDLHFTGLGSRSYHNVPGHPYVPDNICGRESGNNLDMVIGYSQSGHNDLGQGELRNSRTPDPLVRLFCRA